MILEDGKAEVICNFCRVRYDFTESWGVYIGAQFQSLTDIEQSIGSRTARLDQGTTVYGVVGASWRF